MEALSVIAIFDIGKTNKKLLLFDEQYHVVFENIIRCNEITDEDGEPCEDVEALTNWIYQSIDSLIQDNRFSIKAANISAYGASFVFLNKNGKTIPPLYNYLKPFPAELSKKFYLDYGGEQKISKETASPVLGNLNAGMQIYRIKYQLPEKYLQVHAALHLPQFLSYLLTGQLYSDYTSIGCHTQLWNFQNQGYHHWVVEEGIEGKLAPILPCDSIGGYLRQSIAVGVGIHDSSAALIPYLISCKEPFILLSTGTWCISLNPFNDIELTTEELEQDCLCYITFKGNPVKASRLFAGYEHEQAVKALAEKFDVPIDNYKTIRYDANQLLNADPESYESAYHHLINDIICKQVISTNLVLRGTAVKKIFVDGGFSSNEVYMHLLAAQFPNIEIYAANIPQASALGAALAIHHHWNKKEIPTNIIELRLYTPKINI